MADANTSAAGATAPAGTPAPASPAASTDILGGVTAPVVEPKTEPAKIDPAKPDAKADAAPAKDAEKTAEKTAESIVDPAKVEAEKKAATDKAAADAKAKADAPVSFKPPEGSPLKAEDVEGWSGIFKEAGLDSTSAQKLVDAWHKATSSPEAQKAIAAAQEKAAAAVKQQKQTADLASLRADPKMGGANLEATAKAARSVLAQFDGGSEVSKLLAEAGLNNSPAIVRFLTAIRAAHAEDTTSSRVSNSQTPGKPAGAAKTALERQTERYGKRT